MNKQKSIFLSSEGDNWFKRNKKALKEKDYKKDLVVVEVNELRNTTFIDKDITLLEIGCGAGGRIKYIKDNYGIQCWGVDPSVKAIKSAAEKGVEASVGTADNLDFRDLTFDIIVFGFCLYLCDREDLFRIAYEADRVLKNKGYIIILDFYSQNKSKNNEYANLRGIQSYKMDYRSLFVWSPLYECYHHKILHHEYKIYTDTQDEWIAVSTLRKCLAK